MGDQRALVVQVQPRPDVALVDLVLGPLGPRDDREPVDQVAALLLQQVPRLLPRQGPCRVAVLTARVGSIGDNRLGGWYGYRASKAALNMVTALLAQALAERGATVLAFHPGWVMTDMGGDGAQLPAAEAVAAMLRVADAATPADSGRFLNRRGEPMPW